MSEAVELLHEAFAPRMEEKQIRLEVGPDMNLCVRAQPELLVESVLGNLFSNALKFSPKDSVISLKAERLGSEVRIVLCDSGPGVPAEVLQRLTQDGAVPSRVGTAGERGQGYGLQLVQEHVQRMDGRFELCNGKQGGTQAVLWLQAG